MKDGNLALGQDGKPKLCFGNLPGRKRPCIYLWDPLTIRVLGSFRDEEACREVIAFIESMDGARVTLEKGET